MTVAHVAVTAAPSTYDSEHAFAGVAYRYEAVVFRAAATLRRAGHRPADIVGSPTLDIPMGPQRPLSFVALLREGETVDQGILYDGVGPGLGYDRAVERENAATDLAVSAADLVAPFEPDRRRPARP